MKQPVDSYVVQFQAEPSPYHRGARYHWMICRASRPDELVSWGYAGTQEMAEKQAQDEINDLSSGLTKGGRVNNASSYTVHRC
jgi:hypothetical protein